MIKTLIMLIMVLMPSIAAAGVYQCKDASGRSTYSDAPCRAGNVAVVKPNNTQIKNSLSPSSEPVKNDVYTKDMPALESADAASKSCFKHSNTTANYPDPSTSKLLASRKKWVSVKDVGARQIVTVEVTSKNIAGMYVGKQSYDCLLMGDGLTVNTKPYELL
jgi:Domain of unknown function (DUF4124)